MTLASSPLIHDRVFCNSQSGYINQDSHSHKQNNLILPYEEKSEVLTPQHHKKSIRARILKSKQNKSERNLAGFTCLSTSDVKKLEEQNRALVSSVRQNLNKIDRIVKRISNVSRVAIRDCSTSAPIIAIAK